MIRRALFGFFKIPEPKSDRLEKQIAAFGAIKVTQHEVDAWIEAGMPSPPNVFFESYRRQQKDQVTDAN